MITNLPKKKEKKIEISYHYRRQDGQLVDIDEEEEGQGQQE